MRRRPAPTVLLLQALVLALVQGLATFLPVSASGHQEGVVYLAAWDPAGPGFQLALYLGALAAVVLYFRADLWFLVTGTFAIGRTREVDQERARRTVVLLVLASLPGLAAGWWFEPPLFPEFPAERVVAVALYATALLLVAAELLHRRRRADELAVPVNRLSRSEAREDSGRHEGTVGVADALTVGLFQAASIVPGLSRTAVTIVGGMGRGLSRTGATRLSLLLSIPMLAGGALAQYGRLDEAPAGTAPFTGLHVAVAVVTTAAVGYWAIRLLLRLVATDDLLGFARWVALFATLLLIASFLVLG